MNGSIALHIVLLLLSILLFLGGGKISGRIFSPMPLNGRVMISLAVFFIMMMFTILFIRSEWMLSRLERFLLHSALQAGSGKLCVRTENVLRNLRKVFAALDGVK